MNVDDFLQNGHHQVIQLSSAKTIILVKLIRVFHIIVVFTALAQLLRSCWCLQGAIGGSSCIASWGLWGSWQGAWVHVCAYMSYSNTHALLHDQVLPHVPQS